MIRGIARSARQQLAIEGPARSRPGAEFEVEIDGALVPVEHRPLEAAAAALARVLLERTEQCKANAAAAQASLAGNYRCGPDAKACQWSGMTFTVTQAGKRLDIKSDKGDTGTATVTSNISLSAGPPWNMLGVLTPDSRIISWSNGTQWQKL